MAANSSTWVYGETALWASSSVVAPLSGQLAHHSVTERDFDASLECLEDLATLRAWVDAQEAKLLSRISELAVGAAMDRGYGSLNAEEMGESLAASEVGAVLRMPDHSAGRLVDEATLLVKHFPSTVEALQLGKISRRHAVAVAQECCGVPEAEVPDFEAELLKIAGHTTVAKLGNRARRLREKLHPESLPVRKEKKVRERAVTVEPDRDGMAWLSAYLPAEQAHGIANRIEVAARALQCPEELRTLGQLRADVFSDLLTHSCPTDPTVTVGAPSSEGYRGIAARVFVTVPVLTLLGGEEPGELDGYGPLDAETARKLAGHASSFTRLLTHPETGAVLSVGRTRYRPPKDLQDWVRVRDKTCRHPGCNRVAVACEIDHTTPWSQGGTTCSGNLAAFCKKHHMFKTNGFWKYKQAVEGTIQATSLTGKTYTTTADPPPF